MDTVQALRSLRVEFQVSTPAADWPAAAAGELMLLNDVCAVLGLGADQAGEVLGAEASTYVADLLGEAV